MQINKKKATLQPYKYIVIWNTWAHFTKIYKKEVI